MKLTKFQRYTAYIILMEESNSRNGLGLCYLWWHVFGDTTLYHYNKEMLPEYFKHYFKDRPRNWDDRRNILNQCILETHPYPQMG